MNDDQPDQQILDDFFHAIGAALDAFAEAPVMLGICCKVCGCQLSVPRMFFKAFKRVVFEGGYAATKCTRCGSVANIIDATQKMAYMNMTVTSIERILHEH